MRRRILTFNWHEAYLHLLSKVGWAFDVVERRKGGVDGWIRAIRPVPPRFHLLSEAEAARRIEAGAYDRAVAHNLQDLLFLRGRGIPTILVFHNKLSTEIALSARRVDRGEYLARVKALLAAFEELTLVFISEGKMQDWGLAGEILPPGIDPDDYGGYTGELPRVLRVGNGMRERDLMLGFSLQERILREIPSTLLGLNPTVPGAFLPGDWDAYRDQLRRHRLYLNTTMEPYEDGYNLSMLEAMATGMPVVSVANATSPVEDGVNGYISRDEAELRDRVQGLLEDRSRAAALGRRARETVLDRFPLGRFLERWRALLGRGDGAGAFRAPFVPRGRGRKGRKILLSYTSNPQTTGAYLERALRKDHEVVTYGPRITEEVLACWDLLAVRNLVRDHDVPYFTPDLGEVWKRLPEGWEPDLFLWVESGIHFPLDGIERLPCKTACYLVDTHLHLPRHLEWARRFDLVFLAQREYLPRFEEAGFRHVRWLPLACDPEIHRRFETEEDLHVSFVGSLTPGHRRRNRLLLRLAERFPLHVDRCFLGEMARTFSRSRIVFNCSVRNDLNMRVFEALATGALLVTDSAPGSGLEELFEDGRHLVLYRDERELFQRVAYYLEHDEERRRIGEAGRMEVLRAHTYRHRVEEMMAALEEIEGEIDRPLPRDERREGEGLGLDAEVGGVDPARGSAAAGGVEGRIGDGGYFTRDRPEVAALVPASARRILDVGCGGGRLGKRLKEEEPGREIWGVEVHEAAAGEARRWLDHVVVSDASSWRPPVEDGYFDLLVFADVLEHLPEPEAVLRRYLRWLRATGEVVLSIPNVRFWSVVQHLAEGHWTYQDEGLLDRGHLRFFTWAELERMLEGCGLEVVEVRHNVDPRCPEVPPGERIDLQLGRVTVHGLTAEEVREFFVFQFVVRASRKREALLAEAASLEDAGRRSEAFRVYASLMERDPRDASLAAKLAESAETDEDRRRAAEILEGALRIQPARIELLLASARLLVEEGRAGEARERLERILLFAPEHAEARARLRDLGVAAVA